VGRETPSVRAASSTPKQYGVEAQILSDGDLRIGRRFDTKELAVRWATLERAAMQYQG
jgi:hypothetical protein